jgi:hemolysin III
MSGAERNQTLGEEIANSISHGLGALAAAAAAPVLVLGGWERGGAVAVAGAAVFATSMVLLYVISTLYHALAANRAKRVFQVLDHSAIYLLIAGTYTPFALGVLRGPWGWALLALVWCLAVAGIVFKAVWGMRFARLSTAVYLAMGWLALIAFQPLAERLPAWGMFWLFAGGLAYTLGVVFFAAGQRLRYAHFIWHLFVLAGTGCHVVAVYGYAS